MASHNDSTSSEDSVVEILASPPREIDVVTISDADEPSLLFGDDTMQVLTDIVGEVDELPSFDWGRVDAEEVPPNQMGTPPNNVSSDLINMDDATQATENIVQIEPPFMVVEDSGNFVLIPVEIVNSPPTPPPSPPSTVHDPEESMDYSNLPIPDSFSSSIFDSLDTTPSGLFDATTDFLSSSGSSYPPLSPPSVRAASPLGNFMTLHAGHTPNRPDSPDRSDSPIDMWVSCDCGFCNGYAPVLLPPPPATRPPPNLSPARSPEFPYTDEDDVVFHPSRTSSPIPAPVLPARAPSPAAEYSSDSSSENVRQAIRRGRRNVRPSPMVPRPSSRLQQVARRLNFDDENEAGPSTRRSPQPGPSQRQSPQPGPARQPPAAPISRLSRAVFVDREMPRALNQLNMLVEWQNQFLSSLGQRLRSAERREMQRRFAELDIVAFRLNLYFRDYINRLEGNPTSSADSDNEE